MKGVKREIGPYTVEMTNDLITINEIGHGTIWGKTFPLTSIRKQFNDVCNKVEERVIRVRESKQ